MAISLEKPKTEKISISNTKGKPSVLSHDLQSLYSSFVHFILDNCNLLMTVLFAFHLLW